MTDSLPDWLAAVLIAAAWALAIVGMCCAGYDADREDAHHDRDR